LAVRKCVNRTYVGENERRVVEATAKKDQAIPTRKRSSTTCRSRCPRVEYRA